MDEIFGEVIHSYSRAQAIEDGVLVDLMQGPNPESPDNDDLGALVREAGFKFPLAMTTAAFVAAVGPIDGEMSPGNGQSVTGRLWDVLSLLRFAIKRSASTDQTNFTVRVWKKKGFEGATRTGIGLVHLKSICGPGDTAEPVITIMLPNED
jgi:hypothetical protein